MATIKQLDRTLHSDFDLQKCCKELSVTNKSVSERGVTQSKVRASSSSYWCKHKELEKKNEKKEREEKKQKISKKYIKKVNILTHFIF